MALFRGPNIEKLKGRGDVDGLIAALGHRDARVREKAAAALASIGPPTTSKLLAALSDPHTHIREGAAQVLPALGWEPQSVDERVSLLLANRDWVGLARMGDDAAPALLRDLRRRDLSDSSAAVEVGANCLMLARIGGAASADALAGVLRSGQYGAAEAAVALGLMGTPAAPQLATILRDPGVLELVRIFASHSLGFIGPAAADVLIEIVEPRSDLTVQQFVGVEGVAEETWRYYGLLALAGTGDSRARKVLGTLLATEDLELREVLEPVRHALERPPESLVAAIGDPSRPGVRIFAVMALGNRRERSAVEPLVALLDERDQNLSGQAAFALGKLGDPSAAQSLLGRLGHTDASARFAAVIALADAGHTIAIDDLSVVVNDRDELVRAAAAITVGRLRSEQPRPPRNS